MSTATPAFTIRNHAALASFAKRFAPAVNQEEEAPKPPSSADFFGTMRMPENVELDSGPDATIDVQSDFRFIFGYITYYVSAIYPELNVKGHPYASSLSYIAYCLLLVYAHILVCDLSSRRTTSTHALPFRNDSYLADYLATLLNAKLPSFLIPLIEQIAPTYDPRRHRIEFIPSLAGFDFLSDFGRTIVPHALLAAHQRAASTRQNDDPQDLLARYYGTPLVTFNNTLYHMGNLFGTHYNDGTAHTTHSNWLNQVFEQVFNPVVGRFLTTRPTFAHIRLKTYSSSNWANFNPYIYVLSAHPENIQVMQDFTNALSRFVDSEDSRTFPLGSLLHRISGITLLSHSLEPPTLPTWTNRSVSINPKDGKAPTTDADNTTFATTHCYLTPVSPGSEKRSFPTDTKNLETTLYLVENKSYDTEEPPYEYVEFSTRDHVIPYVFYFQPYDVSPSSLGYTVALGIKIESGDFDAIAVPVPSFSDSLNYNNSQYLQGSITLDKVHPTNLVTAATHVLMRYPPSGTDPTAQLIGLAFRDASRVAVPRFRLDHQVQKTISAIAGLTLESNHYDSEKSATYTATSSDVPSTLKDSSVYLWSSYRYVHKHKTTQRSDVSMFATFRGFYGINVTLSRSKNPVVLLPK